MRSTLLLVCLFPLMSYGQNDSLIQLNLWERITEVTDQYNKDEKLEPIHNYFNGELVTVFQKYKNQALPKTKATCYLGFYYYEYSFKQDFNKAFLYMDTLETFIPNLERCSQLCNQIKNSQASAFGKKGEYNESIKIYLETINDLVECNLKDDGFYTQSNLAVNYSKLGDHKKAIQTHLSVFQKLQKQSNTSRLQLAKQHVTLAFAYSRSRQIKEADFHFQKALELLDGKVEKHEKRTLLRALLYSIGPSIKLNNTESAQKTLERARPLQEEINYLKFKLIHAEALVEEKLGNIKIAKQKIQKAIDTLNQHTKNRPYETMVAEYYEKAGDLYKTQPDSSFAFYKKGLESIRNNNDLINLEVETEASSFTAKIQAMDLIFKMIQTGQLASHANAFNLLFDTAELAIFEINSESSKIYLKNRLNAIYEYAINSNFNKFQDSQDSSFLQTALSYSERSKGVLLLQDIFNKHENNSGTDVDSLIRSRQELISEVNALKLRQRDLITRKDTSYLDRVRTKIKENEFRISYLDQKLESKNPGISKLLHLQKSVNRSVQNNEQIIEYFYGNRDLFIFYLNAKSSQIFRVPLDESFRNKIHRMYSFLQGAQEEKPEDFTRLSTHLFQTLLPSPIDSGKNLTIIPDGPLTMIPFDILLYELPKRINSFRDLPYLINRHTISYASSNKTIHFNTGRGNKILAFAPKYSSENPLFNNMDEIENIKVHFKTKVRAAGKASKEVFINEAPDYNYIHIAGHAMYDPNEAENSHIVFSKEGGQADPLFAFEIQQMKLNANLVVLSACETGVGNVVSGEGAFSLARNFFIAGARSILHSLWKADDQSSAMIMEDFYASYKENKDGAAALRNAKLAYLKSADNFTSHPRFWACFSYLEQGDEKQRSVFNENKWLYFTGLPLLLILGFFFLRKQKTI